MLSH